MALMRPNQTSCAGRNAKNGIDETPSAALGDVPKLFRELRLNDISFDRYSFIHSFDNRVLLAQLHF